MVLIGGSLLVALHAVSDVWITGLLGAKLAPFGTQHDQGVSYGRAIPVTPPIAVLVAPSSCINETFPSGDWRLISSRPGFHEE